MHGFAFSAWMVLLLVQTSLVAANRTDIHKRLGVAGAGLGVLMMVLGAYVAISRVAAGLSLSPPGVTALQGAHTAPRDDGRIPGAVGLRAVGSASAPTFTSVSCSSRRSSSCRPQSGVFRASSYRSDRGRGAGTGRPGSASQICSSSRSRCTTGGRALGRIHPATLWGGVVLGHLLSHWRLRDRRDANMASVRELAHSAYLCTPRDTSGAPPVYFLNGARNRHCGTVHRTRFSGRAQLGRGVRGAAAACLQLLPLPLGDDGGRRKI